MGVDGIMVIADDPNGLNDVVKKAKDAGIPTIAYDGDCNAPDLAGWLTSDNYGAGFAIGQQMVKDLNGKGNLFIIDIPALMVCKERVQGVVDAIAGTEIKVIDTQVGGAMTDGMKVMENRIQKYDKIDAVYCINDDNALGCVQALEQAQRDKDTLVYGNDGVPAAYEAMKDGRCLAATVQQQSYKMGQIPAEMLMKAIKGEKVETPIFVPTYLVTRQMVKDGLKRPENGANPPEGVQFCETPPSHTYGTVPFYK